MPTFQCLLREKNNQIVDNKLAMSRPMEIREEK